MMTVLEAMKFDGPKSLCQCGHRGDGPVSMHRDLHMGEGKGPCIAKGCRCQQFVWKKFRTDFKAFLAAGKVATT